MPLALTLNHAGWLCEFDFAGKHAQLLSIVLPVLVLIQFGEDAVQRVGDNLQKQIMRMRLWERFSFLNYCPEKVIGLWVNVSCSDAGILHSSLRARRNELESLNDHRRLTGLQFGSRQIGTGVPNRLSRGERI